MAPGIPKSAKFIASAMLAIAIAATMVAATGTPAEAQSPPATPSSVSLSRDDGTVTASWAAISNATKYHVTYTTDGGSSWHAPVEGHTNIASNGLTFNADNAKSYIVGVRAGNDHGWSGWRNSAQAGPYTPPAPNPVDSVTATANNGNVTASWDAVDGATKYHVTYIAVGNGTWQLAALDHSTTSITISGTDNTKAYVVGARAGNDNGWSSWVNSPSVGPYAPLPGPVSAVTVTRTDGTLLASWDAASHATHYHVTYMVNGSNDWKLAALTHTSNSIDIGGVDDNKVYVVGVRSGNSRGWTGWVNSAPAAAHDTSAVTLTASQIEMQTATLTLGGSHTGAWYYQRTLPTAGACTTVNDGTTTVTVTGLTAGEMYGYSAYSDSNCKTPLAHAPNFTTLMSISHLDNTVCNNPSECNAYQVNSSTKHALAFTTSSASGSGYKLKSVTLKLQDEGTSIDISVALHAMASTGTYSESSTPAAGATATLTGTAPTAGDYQDTTYTCPNDGCALEADTTYFLVATSQAPPGGDHYNWAQTRSNDIAATTPADNGWRIEKGHTGSISGGSTSWSTLGVSLAAKFTFAPEAALAGEATTDATATLTIANHSGDWHYKADAAPHTECQGPVSGNSVGLTDLTGDVTYTYTAYSDSSCTSANELATAKAFTTLQSVSNLDNATSGGTKINWSINQAGAFTVSSSAGEYTLKSVTMPLKYEGSATGNLAVALHGAETTDGKHKPESTALTNATLSGDPPTTGLLPDRNGMYTDTVYTCSGDGCELEVGKTYFIVAKSANHDPAYDWAYSPTTTEVTNPSGNGWSIGQGQYKTKASNAWTTWTGDNVMKIVFEHEPPPPTLASSGITSTGATLTIANYDGTWYYMATSGPHTSCSSAQTGTTAALSGLTSGQSYTYTAYSDSGCSTALASAPAFTTT